MNIVLKNEHLTLEADTIGAQLRRILTKKGRDILWRGDEAYWRDSAPILFPFIGRLYEERHEVKGTSHPMTIHGFASLSRMDVAEQTQEYVLFRMSENVETLRSYPFPFQLEIGYRLCANVIEITYRVHNTGSEPLSFGIGGHPGFNVPLEEGLSFEDYELAFMDACRPMRIGFDESILLSGRDIPYPLEEDRRLGLRHELFDEDAIILAHTAKGVVLQNCLIA